MRVVLLTLLVGCSFAPQPGELGTGNNTPATDGPADTPDGPVEKPAPFALDGHDWLLPCITNGQPNNRACTCAGGAPSTAVTIGGTPGDRWKVTVRIRGVMERMGYTGGVPGSDGWYVGGAPGDTGNNYYKLSISAPASHYFINRGTPSQSNSWPFDYEATLAIEAGATVTFEASGQDQVQWEGVDPSDQAIAIADIADPAQPFNGQFAQLDVIAAEPQ